MYLRKLKESDAEYMLEWMHDENVIKKMAADFMHMTIDDCIQFISNSNLNESIMLNRAICSDEDEYLGTVSLKNISHEDNNAEYAIILRSKAMGTGAAKVASRKILEIAFKELNLHKVYLYVKSSNLRARKFYEKFGFQCEGIFRDHVKTRDGQYEDLLWMSVLENEFTEMEDTNE